MLEQQLFPPFMSAHMTLRLFQLVETHGAIPGKWPTPQQLTNATICYTSHGTMRLSWLPGTVANDPEL